MKERGRRLQSQESWILVQVRDHIVTYGFLNDACLVHERRATNDHGDGCEGKKKQLRHA